MKTLLLSKTVWGAILGAASLIVSNVKNPEAWAQGLGIIISAIGVRDAIRKNGTGD